MNKLVWADENNVHLHQFDNQHKLLFSLINDLIELEKMPPQLQKQLHAQVLNILADAILQHFNAEELFMVHNAYPEELRQQHKSEHVALVESLNEFIRRYTNYSKPFTDEMVAYLYKWLVQHIRVFDRKLGEYFADKQTEPPLEINGP